jgi:hypothetical protein
VAINPNGQTISTYENEFEVEAVMDITIDIEQAASMADLQVTLIRNSLISVGLCKHPFNEVGRYRPLTLVTPI